METGINIWAVLIANFLGIMLLAVVVFANRWTLGNRSKESRTIVVMVLLALICCLIDPLVSMYDGHPGSFAFACVYLGNWCLFFSNLILGPVWVLLICLHLNVPFARWAKYAIVVVDLLCFVPLVVNFFVPVVFGVDAHNNYFRGMLYWLYVVVAGGFLVAGLLVYLYARMKGGALKVFPIVLFCLPVVAGIALQSMVYGVSTIWPCVAIGVAGVTSGIQTERIYHDHLTGLYSRSYFEYLKRRSAFSKKSQFTAIMLDLNGFKNINDQFGHTEGDRALIKTGELLEETVGSLGVVIRYAGDEFIILLNTQDDALVNEMSEKIKAAFSQYNEVSGKGYRLSLAQGVSKTVFGAQSIDMLMDEIDERMFEDKRAYYERHPEKDRRRR